MFFVLIYLILLVDRPKPKKAARAGKTKSTAGGSRSMRPGESRKKESDRTQSVSMNPLAAAMARAAPSPPPPAALEEPPSYRGPPIPDATDDVTSGTSSSSSSGSKDKPADDDAGDDSEESGGRSIDDLPIPVITSVMCNALNDLKVYLPFFSICFCLKFWCSFFFRIHNFRFY